MEPAAAFSLLCRTVADVTAVHRTNGHNLPLLLLFRVVLSQRNLAFEHDEGSSSALMGHIIHTYLEAKLDETAQHLDEAFQVPAGALDVAERVKVRQLGTG